MLVPNRYEYNTQSATPPTEAEKKQLDEKMKGCQKELYILTQELVKETKLWEQQIQEWDKDPEFFIKSFCAFDGKSDLDWLLSGATQERLQQELATLIKEYYQLWTEITNQINQIIQN